jgi:hypothetical protein
MLNRKRFRRWITQVYGTAEAELDCDQTQQLLPVYVEAQTASVDQTDIFAKVRDHWAHCPRLRRRIRRLARRG